MPKSSVDQWDTTAANNTDVGGVNIAEGCPPSTINDAIRTVMSQVATYDADIPRVDENETVSGNWTISGGWNFTGTITLTSATVAFGVQSIPTAALENDSVTVGKIADATLKALAGLATGANKIPRATGTDTFDQIDFLDEDGLTSDSATGVASQQSIKAYVDALPITEEYVSSEQTITSGGDLTLAHGLSSTPKIFTLLLKCQTAEGNWSIGDELVIAPGANANQGCTLAPDATNIFLQYGSNGSVFAVNNEVGGAGVSLTNANWTLIVKAWA